MTDEKKRSMADGDHLRSLEDIITDVAEAEFAELPSEPMTPDRLYAISAARESASRRRHVKALGGIAAIFLLALIGLLIAVNTLSVDVGADKNKKEEIVTEDGVVIEDGGYGASTNLEGTWNTDDWLAIPTAKALYPQLMIPEYIPNEYVFQQLTIELIETGDFTSRYLYTNRSNETLELEVFTQNSGEISLGTENGTRILECTKGMIFILEDQNKIATMQRDDGFIRIWCNLPDGELIKIIENLEG